MNRTFTQKSIRFSLLMLTVTGMTLGAQELKKPTLGFTDACVTADHNEFPVELVWNPNPIVNSDNQFIIELSDASGSFTSPTTIATLSDKNATFKIEITDLRLPNTVSGENYRLRWRSTSPAQISPASDPFGAYSIKVSEPLVVNNFEEASVCDGTSVFLEVDNYPNEASYNWYNYAELIPGEHGPSLEVTEPGIYFAEIDYGSYCSSSTASNMVEVNIENSIGFELIGAKELSLCEGETYTLTTDLDDPELTYAWYKDGVLLQRNNQNTLEVDGSDPGFAGDYYVVLEREGGCKETTSKVSISAGSFESKLILAEGTLLLPEETLSIAVETTAINPSFQWFRNETKLEGETGKTIEATVAGDYYVTIAQHDNCIVKRTTDKVSIQEPDSYIASIQASSYTPCVSSSTELSLGSITAVKGEETFGLGLTTLDKFSYQWIYNNKELSGATQRTLSIADARKNGTYALRVVIEGGIKLSSDPIEVSLSLPLTVNITAESNIRCENGNSIVIQSSVKDQQFDYSWFRNSVELTEKGSELSTNLSGEYQLEITAYGCTLSSNSFSIEDISPSVVQLNVSDLVVIPEGQTKTVTASGGDSYQWFDAMNELIGSERSITIQEEGEYTLVAGVGQCQLTKTFKVSSLESYAIPNVITPNGDGFNDLWIIPNSYAYQKEVTVNIYSQLGTRIYSTNEYQNNWPESSSINQSGGQPPIYYYSITKGKETLKQGTITLIR
ncbi:gliding motility-associated C-terminal domain-containing protein [Galbibacter sp.]|uniref:T9SS type B sorting domain-containing protein n=1 Tax=Galbibacter sp. TaxID=2918471 RepID=UPI003A8F9824